MLGKKICGVILALLALGVQAAEPPLTVRFSGQEYPPYIMEKMPGNGILSAVVTEAFRRANVTVKYEWFPNNRAIQMARTGDVDGSMGWTPNEDRLRDLLFSDEVLPFRMVLFHRAGEMYPWATLSDLAPYRFGITAGNFYSDVFSNLQAKGVLKVDIASDDVSNLRKLVAKRIDLFPMEGESGLLLARRSLPPEQARRIVAQDHEYWTTPLCVVIWRKHPQGAELIARFNRELKKMRDSGELGRLISKTRQQVYAHQEGH